MESAVVSQLGQRKCSSVTVRIVNGKCSSVTVRTENGKFLPMYQNALCGKRKLFLTTTVLKSEDSTVICSIGFKFSV